MDWDGLGRFLDSHGFPIVVALALLYHVIYVERREAEAILSMVNALDQLATSIRELYEKFDRLWERH